MATFAQAYALQHGATRPQVLLGFAVASFLAIFGVLLAGRLSDRFGRRPVLVAGIVGWAALAFPMFALWGSGNALLITLGFVIGLQFQSLTYGPLGAFISEQFGTEGPLHRRLAGLPARHPARRRLHPGHPRGPGAQQRR